MVLPDQSTLRKQLDAIRRSVVRFEKELSLGAQRKQQENDRRFEVLQSDLHEIEGVVDNESTRLQCELVQLEERAKEMTTVFADELAKNFSASLEEAARPLESYAAKCVDWGMTIRSIEKKRNLSELEDALNVLKSNVHELREKEAEYDAAQEALEKEVMRQVVKVQNKADQEINHWTLLTNDVLIDLRSTVGKAIGEGEEERLETYDGVLRMVTDGIVCLPEAFEKVVCAELTNIRRTLEDEAVRREESDNDIVEAVQKYTQTLQKSLRAAEMLQIFADEVARES